MTNRLTFFAIFGAFSVACFSGCGSSGDNTDSTGDGSVDVATGQGGSAQGGSAQGGGAGRGGSGLGGSGQGGSGQGGSGQGGSGQGGSGQGGEAGEGGSGQGGAGPIDADFAYDAPPIPFDELPERCRDAAEKGVQWLASVQQADGSWADYSRVAATSLSLTKLQTYALEHDQDPFDPSFRYHEHIQKGFNYLFEHLVAEASADSMHDANRNGRRIKTTEGSPGYVTSLALMAITAGRGFDQIVRSSNDLNGKTYQEIAQDMVDYFGDCQANGGGWRYGCKADSPDNSVTQFVTLALEYATHPDYAFFCQFDESVKTGLAQFITSVQDSSGASGYTPGNLGYSALYRTGALLQELAFLGIGPGETLPAQPQKRVDMALGFIDTNFNDFFTGAWGGGNSHYMGMWSVMKGMVTQDLKMVGAHDWYEEYCDKLVAQQRPTGAWPGAAFYPGGGSFTETMSTAFALLVLEKAAPRKLH